MHLPEKRPGRNKLSSEFRNLKQARTLKFENYTAQLHLLAQAEAAGPDLALKPRPELLARLEATWGFKFRSSAATAEVGGPWAGQPMNRLLQGMWAGQDGRAGHAVTCALNGYKAVLMAPTEVVASQHFSTLEPAARSLNVSLRLLTGSSKKREGEGWTGSPRPGWSHPGGDPRRFQGRVQIRDLALVVTDEQHRSAWASAFLAQGDAPRLVMSATPYPDAGHEPLWRSRRLHLRTKPEAKAGKDTWFSSRRRRS